MKYRRFGKTEMVLSQLSLGCMRFTGDTPEDVAIANALLIVPLRRVLSLSIRETVCPGKTLRSDSSSLSVP